MTLRHFLFVSVVAGLTLGTANLVAQTRDFDFDASGKPTQVGGPGFTGVTPAPTTPAPQPAPTTPTTTTLENGTRFYGVSWVWWVLGVGVIGLVVWLVVRGRAVAQPAHQHQQHQQHQQGQQGQQGHQHQQHQQGQQGQQGQQPPRHAGPPAHLMAPAPQPPPAPPAGGTPPAQPAPNPRPGGGMPPAAPVVAIFALLLTGQVVKAADYTVFPSAVPVGGSVNAIVSGSNAATLTGCAVALPEVGCSLVHAVSPTQAMVRLTAGANALGGRTEPARGALRLVFGGSSVTIPNAVAVGTSEQVGVAMLAPHANPPQPTQKPQVIYRTTQVVRNDPALAARVTELERWRQTVTTVVAPAPVVATTPAPAPTLAPQPQSVATANVSSQFEQKVLQELGQLRTTQLADGRRIDGLVTQVGTLQTAVGTIDAGQRKLNGGIETIAVQTAKNTRNKGDRCGFLADLRAKGFTVQNPQAMGCSK